MLTLEKKKKSPGSLILNHSIALATHWMKPWAWKEGLFHCSGIRAGKRKHVIRMSCLRFALLPSSMRRWEARKQRKGRVSKSSYSFGRKCATWFLKQMTQKRSRIKPWDSGRAVPRKWSEAARWKHGCSFTFTSSNLLIWSCKTCFQIAFALYLKCLLWYLLLSPLA